MELLPTVVPLGTNLWGASFKLTKMLPAHHSSLPPSTPAKSAPTP